MTLAHIGFLALVGSMTFLPIAFAGMMIHTKLALGKALKVAA